MNSLILFFVTLCLVQVNSFTFLPASTFTASSSLSQHQQKASSSAQASSTSLNLFGGSKKPADGAAPAAEGGKGGMFDGMNSGQFMESMQKAQEIAAKTKTLQDDLHNTLVTGTSGPVTITITATQVPKSVELSESFGSLSKGELESAFKDGMIDAYKRSLRMAEDRMRALYSEYGIPMPEM
jgi:DNA-binding protein YbaB